MTLAPLWLHEHRLLWTMLASAVLCALAVLPPWAHQQRAAFERRSGDASYLPVARQSVLVVEHRLPPPLRWSLVLSAAAGAVAAGVFLGAVNVVNLDPLGLAGGLLVLLVAQILWVAVHRLLRAKALFRGLTLVALLGVIPLFGMWCWSVFYAGLGLAMDDVDVSQVDTWTVGAHALALPLALAGGGFVAVFLVDRHSRLWSPALAVMTALAILGVLSGTLSEAQTTGRRLAMGLPTQPAEGVRIAPGPKAKCLTWVSADSGIAAGQLPRPMWQIGILGDRLLLLLPDEAARADPLPAGKDPATYRPGHDVGAPIRTVGRDQVRSVPPAEDGTCRAT